jgi:hypothetical protein
MRRKRNMNKKVVVLFAVVIGLILSVEYVASGSPISASESLQFGTIAVKADPTGLANCSLGSSGLSRHRNVMAAEVAPCSVDFNGSGIVDIGDVMRVANCWRSTDPACDPYDLDDDGKITIVDIMLVAADWGNPCLPFAIDMGGYDTDPTRRDLAAAAGFNMHRTSVSWAGVEPNAPVGDVHTYNWPDSTFNLYRNDRRLKPYVIVMDNPSWAAEKACGPIDPDYLGDFGEFVYQLVSRYADVTPYWIFYNEQDQWTTVGGDAGGCWGGHGVEYAQILAVAWDAAHSADPYVRVIFGAVAYEPDSIGAGSVWDPFFLRDAFQYMQDHEDDYVDIIAANQYNAFRDYWDSSLPTNQEIIAKFLQAVDDASFNPGVAGSYSIYKWQIAYGLDKPMASGEVGLQVSMGPVDVPTMEELQARHAVHVNVRGMAAGLKIISWYTLKDKPSDSLNYGLVRADGTLRPAYTAYQVLAQQLDGYVFDQQVVVSDKPNIQAYRFDQDGVKKLVLWRDNGQKIKQQSTTDTETMTISAAELGTWTGQVRVTDMMGNFDTYSDPSSVDLTFSSSPIYVEAVQ